jgi:hypothetical protein
VTVRLPGGRSATAASGYESLIHSGELEDVPRNHKRAMEYAGRDPASLEASQMTVIVDGRLFAVTGVGAFPEFERGSAEEGGFAFGGLDARLEILNYGYTADRSFEVRRTGAEEHGQPVYETSVDGEEVERGAHRPFRVSWGDTSPGSGTRVYGGGGGTWL